MATFLTNPKMAPALRARIEASVRGGKVTRSKVTPTMRSALRLTLALAVVGSVGALTLQWRHLNVELEAAKQKLQGDVALRVAPLESRGPAMLSFARAALTLAAGDYEADFVDPSLRDGPALDALLARPAVYIRGPIGSFAGGSGFEQAVTESQKDAFLSCLLDRPSSRSEKDLLVNVRDAYRGKSAATDKVDHVASLGLIISARSFMGEGWTEQVQSARSLSAVDRLRTRAERVSFESAVKASEAELLIYLLDEPKKAGTAEEVDGACDHMVRVGILQVEPSETLLRVRRRVDPSWIAEANRAYLARGLNGCRLAVDLRDEVLRKPGDAIATAGEGSPAPATANVPP